MRRLLLITLILIALQINAAAQPSGKEYFDMPVARWLGLSYREHIKSARAIAEEGQLEMCRKKISEVVDCMRALGPSPVWKGSNVGTLFTKCSFEMGEAKSQSEERWDALVTCVKKEVPDFSKDEFFSLGLSAAGAALAKDAGNAPIMTPRTRKILTVMDRCEKK